MGRICTVCFHSRREEIDLALLMHTEGYRRIAARYGLHEPSLRRHESDHLGHTLEQSKELAAMLSADNLLEKLSHLDRKTLALLYAAEQRGDIRAALGAVRESRGNIEAYARIGPNADIEARLRKLEEGQPEGEANGNH